MPQYDPLRGVSVLAFEVATALPVATRMLADLGADVLRIASPERAATLVEWLDGVHTNKSTLVLDLKTDEGRDLARRLAAQADIVCTNYRPGTLTALGLDYDTLRALRPDLIMLQLSGYGTPGPWQDYPAYGPSAEAAGGLTALTGPEDAPPLMAGSDVYGSYVGGRFAALALVAALEHRRATGAGRYIDLSMMESVALLLGDALMSTVARGKPPRRRGNRDARYIPQGVYRCRGDDEWLALTVMTEEHWRALRGLIGDARIAGPQFESRRGRRAAQNLIDAAISDWTGGRDKLEAATLLQEQGIPAGPVLKASEVATDPQLQHRGFFVQSWHRQPLHGALSHPQMTLPWIVAGCPRPEQREAQIGAAETRRLLKRRLGLSAEQVAQLKRAGALSDVEPLAHVRAGLYGGVRPSAGGDGAATPSPQPDEVSE